MHLPICPGALEPALRRAVLTLLRLEEHTSGPCARFHPRRDFINVYAHIYININIYIYTYYIHIHVHIDNQH